MRFAFIIQFCIPTAIFYLSAMQQNSGLLVIGFYLRVLYSANILGQTLDKLLDYEMYAHEDRPNNAAPPEIGVQAKTVKQRATVA